MAHTTSPPTAHRARWLYLLQGVVAVVLGLALLLVPMQTLFAFVIALGAYWFVRGVATLVALAADPSNKGWKIFVGLLGIVAGALAMISPVVTGTVLFTYLVFLIAFQAILSGITEVYYGVQSRRFGLLLLGLVSLLLGGALILNPWVGIAALVMFSGAFSLTGGIISIAAIIGDRPAEAAVPT